MPPAPRSARSRQRARERQRREIEPCARSFEYRDAAGQPIDVDVELALARGKRDASAVGASVGEKTDRADIVVDQIALCGKELELELLRQFVHPRVGRNTEGVRGEVEHQHGLAALRDRLAARLAQARGNGARIALELGRRHAAAEHRDHDGDQKTDQRQHHQHLDQRESGRGAHRVTARRTREKEAMTVRFHGGHCSQLVTSLSPPSPPSLPSAPYEMMSYGPCDPGDAYWYSLPHGSFGTVDFFQYGPFQFVMPAGAVINACNPSCEVG